MAPLHMRPLPEATRLSLQERGLFPKPHSVPHVQAAAAEMYHVGSSP